ncbi:MAG: DUF1045 domain-containing protein [Pseudomonadota bacterium]|nr:DUF1045 domain-containing protein [Pseudomonadota bacterium]
MSRRYAIYFVPDDKILFQRASRWLGWDCIAAETPSPLADEELANPAGLHIRDVSATPRKYGFHGTIKPPFSLAEAVDDGMLAEQAQEIATSLQPIILDGLEMRAIGGFLALVPRTPSKALNTLAARFVTDLDHCRRPAAPTELARRRAAGLTPRQEELLMAWGYPYVLDEFRFHLTLTGRLDRQDIGAAQDMLSAWIGPVVPHPFRIDRLALVEEGDDGLFRVVRWLPLGAGTPDC